MELRPGYKQSDVGVIPDDWDAVPLSLTAKRITRGASPRPIDSPVWFDSRSSVGWVRISDVTRSGRYLMETTQRLSKEGIRRSRPVPSGSLIMSICATVGRPIETRIDTCIHDGFVVFDQPSIDQSYLYHVLAALEPAWSKHGQTGSQMNLNTGLINGCPIPLPPTETEQRAIAQALSDVDELLATLDKLIAKKRDLKQATMQQLLTGETRLPGFSGDWDVVEFGDIATIRNEKILCSSTPEGTPCVELEFIGQANGRLLGYIEAKGASSKYSFKEGDVLFGRLRAYLRKHWRATFDGVCSTEIWPLIPRNERLYGGYLHLLVQMNSFVDAACVSYGTHMPRSDWAVLGKFEVQLPSVPEQAAISASLSSMDAELETLEKRLEKTRQLKQAMMQELLTGKTRLVEGGYDV